MLIKPKPLKPNSQIALVAPAGPVTDNQLVSTQDTLLKMGFKTQFTQRILNRKGYLAGNDSERLDDLHEAFTNQNIDAILCIRGGYGSARIIDKINYQLIKQNPKIFIGFSDITALLNSIWQKTGLITFHGVVGTSDFSEYTTKQFHHAFNGYLSDDKQLTSNDGALDFLCPGTVNGRLVGGNLAIVNSLIGTGFDIDFTDKIVFIEDVAEAPYKIDRMLTQLLLAGKLQKAAGLILGKFKGCDIDNVEITSKNSLSLNEVFIDRLANLNIPIIKNFSFGHVKNQAIFPVGAKVEINSKSKSLKLLESILET